MARKQEWIIDHVNGFISKVKFVADNYLFKFSGGGVGREDEVQQGRGGRAGWTAEL